MTKITNQRVACTHRKEKNRLIKKKAEGEGKGNNNKNPDETKRK